MATEEKEPKYEGKGDFGPYNEPSWVPEGFCKCCATVRVGTEVKRKPLEELQALLLREEKTSKKELEVRRCPECDRSS